MRSEESQRRKRSPQSQQRTAPKNDRKSGWEEKEEGNAKTVVCGNDITSEEEGLSQMQRRVMHRGTTSAPFSSII